MQVNRSNGRTLDCWLSGGEHFDVEPPERPYFYDRSFHPKGDEVTRAHDLNTKINLLFDSESVHAKRRGGKEK